MAKFLRVLCECGTKITVFGASKTEVNCNNCGNSLVKPAGGKARVSAKIVEVLQ